jgi:hypothetical protein
MEQALVAKQTACHLDIFKDYFIKASDRKSCDTIVARKAHMFRQQNAQSL